MKKTCQRCQAKFDCTPEAITTCGCSTLQLHPDTHAYLDKTLYDCLCNTCLQELDNLVSQTKNNPLPSPSSLQQGTHYYMENGFIVFTELYHLTRGYCCGSGCRHCAYGFKKT